MSAALAFSSLAAVAAVSLASSTGSTSSPNASSSFSSSSAASSSSPASSPAPPPSPRLQNQLRCLNATPANYNATLCGPWPPDVDERWRIQRLSIIVPVAVGGVVLAILSAVVAFILYHRQRRRRQRLKTTSGYSATSFNSSVEVAAHANPALQAPDICEADDFSLDNDSFLHTLETAEDALGRAAVSGPGYGQMRAPPARPQPPATSSGGSGATVTPAPPPSKLEPLGLCVAPPSQPPPLSSSHTGPK